MNSKVTHSENKDSISRAYFKFFGTINPVKEIITKAKEAGAVTCLDVSQSIQHTKIDVRELNCDFLVFSGHNFMVLQELVFFMVSFNY